MGAGSVHNLTRTQTCDNFGGGLPWAKPGFTTFRRLSSSWNRMLLWATQEGHADSLLGCTGFIPHDYLLKGKHRFRPQHFTKCCVFLVRRDKMIISFVNEVGYAFKVNGKRCRNMLQKFFWYQLILIPIYCGFNKMLLHIT